ncbi:MAG: CapA family protein [Synergistaceae bacterium]|nr:CapA family protein [Synergistaceae bacterium]
MKKDNLQIALLAAAAMFSALLMGFTAAYCISADGRLGVTEAPAEISPIKRVKIMKPYIFKSMRAEAEEGPWAPEYGVMGTRDGDSDKSVVLSFVGDCTLGQNYGAFGERSFSAVYWSTSPEYFFEGVRDIFASDDLTIVNCEGVLTRSAVMRDKPELGPKYWFKGLPEYAYIFSAGSVEIANIANNHTRDFGNDGYQDTKDALSEAGIEYFGNDDVLVRQVRNIKIGFFGLSASAGAGIIKERIAALQSDGAEVIIASFHGGATEIVYTPTDSQKKAAHIAVDNGAAFVMEHHPHVLQGIERYNGGVIAYSLGNFCFGGHTNPSDKDTVIFQVVLSKSDEGITSSYRVIPASISSRPEYNDYRPSLLEGAEAERVLEKIALLSDTVK